MIIEEAVAWYFLIRQWNLYSFTMKQHNASSMKKKNLKNKALWEIAELLNLKFEINKRWRTG